MNYIIATLGCKVNQYETQAIETILQSHGHVNATPADVVIVNTCAVTAESGRKSRQTINKLKAENPGAIVAVCGCYSQAEEVDEDIVFGTNDKTEFVKAIEEKVSIRNIDNPFKRHSYEFLPGGAMDGRTRAMLKIQDGCHNFCTYCIIPYTRGRLRSLDLNTAALETAKLKEEGFKELVLTGIEIASYGVDLEGKPTLADVVEVCARAAGDMRIRLGSLEPTVITEEFCVRLSKYSNICRHFHLALQSGCDKTLKDMNRKYDTARFYESCELLRKYFPGCALTCDMIVGFPQETEEDFESTLAFIQKCAFSQMHIFPYSRRPGTVADKMPGQILKSVKSERAKRAQAIADKMHEDFLSTYIGKTVPVLIENNNQGHTDTYIMVHVDGETLRNEYSDVKIERFERGCLYGKSI